ncbi:DUF2391 family protein, partial [Nostoc sp. FACHB-110]|uniref:DUF2391 family protein n=1 Tax=Nostoc sp. FACHB-110 TaxID=2692834 RepID=UPI0037CC61EF
MGKKPKKNVWLSEVNDIIRGACGGFLFGVPLLYTMEVWWVGSQAKPQLIMMAIAVTFIVVFLLNRTEGFRKRKYTLKPYEALTDTIEALAIGIVCSSFILFILREITLATPLREALGKIIFESVPFALGVSLANQFLEDVLKVGDYCKKAHKAYAEICRKQHLMSECLKHTVA